METKRKTRESIVTVRERVGRELRTEKDFLEKPF